MCCAQSLSHVQLCVTLWTTAHQAPLSMGFSRQEYWSGLPCPPPGDLPNPGMNLGLPHCRQNLFCLNCQVIAGLFVTPQTWKATAVALTLWVDKQINIYQFSEALLINKENKLLIHATIWHLQGVFFLLLPFNCWIDSIVGMWHALFIYSLVEGHLGSFPDLINWIKLQ